ncbi:MAG: hypothetical protein ACPHRO_04965, partial [Nannocystaceae bacterium]
GDGDVCGDGQVTGGETCDGADLNGSDCAAQGFDAGTLTCNATCDGFDTSACTYTCGDDGVDPGETCDGTDLDGEDCVSQGFASGTLACAATCDGFDTSACVPIASCGDGNVDMGEVCDGANLNSETCVSQGFDTGTLACDASCTAFDTSACAYTCGDNGIDPGETCDGTDLAGEDCASQGFDAGTLACDTNCGGFDTSACTYTCGDDGIDPGETCDGTDLGGEDCASQGFDAGTLACDTDCGGFDTSACTYTCGDDGIDPGETCDGTDLGGQDCTDFGFLGGTLACDTDCGGYDTSGCSNTMNVVSSYRITSMAVRDPHFIIDLPSISFGLCQCADITNNGASCFGNDVDPVNDQLNAQLCSNAVDPLVYDLSTILHFTNLDPITDGASAALQIEENAACEFDAGCANTPCTPGASAAPSTSWETSATGNTACLSFDPAVVGPDNNGTPFSPINEPGPICYFQSSPIGTLNIPFNGTILPLQDAETAAEYDPQGDAAPGTLVTGVIQGFLSQSDAGMIVVSDDPPFNLDNILPGGTDNGCSLGGDAKDNYNGEDGWWFYVDFTAEAVTYTGVVP